MVTRVPIVLKSVLLTASVLLVTACGVADPGVVVPTAHGPQPSPKPAFTGLALPATMTPPSKTPTAAEVGQSANTRSRTSPLTILYTNDTGGFVDPCG